MYRAFAISAIQTWFAYRGMAFGLLFGELVRVFATIAIWMSVYHGQSSVAGATLRQMITYAVVGGTVVAIWYPSTMIETLGRTLKSGDVAIYLLKPLSYPLYLLATEVGSLIYATVAIALPVVVVIALAYGITPPASGFDAAMFVVYWLVGFLMHWVLAAIAGVLAFWMMTTFSLDWFLRAMTSILSGIFLPFWFFPEPLAGFVRQQPFAWIAYYPTAVYLGKIDTAGCWIELGAGLGWLAVLTLALAALWRRTSGRLVIQGG